MANYYREAIKKFKTVAAQKAFLTREIKLQKEYIKDLEESQKRQGGKFWFYNLGDKLNTWSIDKQKDDLKVIERMRLSLNK